MSEREADETPPMSPSMREYVDAFSAVERPAADVVPATWEAIEQATAPNRRRLAWIGAAAAAVAAAAVILAVGRLDGALFDRSRGETPAQATHEGARGPTGGSSVHKTRPEASEAATPVPVVQPPQQDVEAATSQSPVAVDAKPEPPERKRNKASAKRSAAADRPVESPQIDRSLSADLRRFKAAKQAQDSGASRQALLLLDSYAEDFPQGAFRRESQVLRAQALCALGRAVDAEKLRDRFLETHPASPLASRMRAVCR